jgi:hypothetical protein
VYLVVACSRCRRARVVEQGRKTASCASCARSLRLADLRAAYAGPSLDEAQHAAGLVNARLAGREGEYVAALVVPDVPRARGPRHDDRFSAADAAARRVSSEKDRADAVARSLGEFDDPDLLKVFATVGLRDPARHLRRMLATQVVYEPRPGVYRAL